MYSFHLFLLVTCASSVNHRKNIALVSRHRQTHSTNSQVVPNPDSTVPQLNSLETTIRQWPQGGLGASTTATGATSAAVENLNADIRELSNWSSDGMAKLMGATSSQEVSIGVLRSQFDQFRNDTRRTLSRIQNALQNIGAEAADGSTQSANSLQTRLKTIQTQLDTLTSNSKNVSGFGSQLTTAQEAIVQMNSRLVALEDYTGINAASNGVQSAESTSLDSAYLGFDFMLQSWTGRFAMIGVGLGLIALILGVVALTMLPKKPAVPKGDEQVLLEAGGEEEDPNAAPQEGQEGYDPNAEQYYYQEGAQEQQQQEQVPAT